MNLKRVLEELDFAPDKRVLDNIKRENKIVVESLKKWILKKKIDADVFVGGSFAKGTLGKGDEYDVDIFVRFGWKYKSLSDVLEDVLDDVSKELKAELSRIHGSRIYFRLEKQSRFEIIPVLRIKKVNEAKNVMDLSYFHVNYVKKNLPKNARKDVRLAKQFCKAQKVYGAESYINGFSGYGLECLIIYYGSFEKMIRELVKIKEKIAIDPAGHYKKSRDVFFELNESKLHGPIVLVDPTWKERNILAALSWESFKKFQETAVRLLKNPSDNFFFIKKTDREKLKNSAKNNGAEFVHIILESDRQNGDIAGTKLRKFSRYLERILKKYFEIKKYEFEYAGGKSADFYLIVKSKGKISKMGPPVKMKEHVKRFKIKNKKTFIKKGIIFANIKIDFSAKDFLRKLIKEERDKMEEMSIVDLKVVD